MSCIEPKPAVRFKIGMGMREVGGVKKTECDELQLLAKLDIIIALVDLYLF